jgi:MFS transporter, OFA family, oxalate/formate antiporter
MAGAVAQGAIHPSRIPNRWVQLSAGVVAMMAIASLQYAWTLFAKPLTNSSNTLAAIQVAFAAAILTETWLAPIEDNRLDHHGLCAMLALRNRSCIGSKGGEKHG